MNNKTNKLEEYIKLRKKENKLIQEFWKIKGKLWRIKPYLSDEDLEKAAKEIEKK